MSGARYPSGKGEVCKTFMRRFDSDPRLQHFTRINRGLVVKKYDRELQRLDAFYAGKSKLFFSEIALESLTEYRASGDELYPSSATRQQVQTRLRGFLRFCYDARWLDRVP